jgi:glycosyltransferase involved in cell wall biosynthesis
MAAGKPVISVTGEDSEVSRIVHEENIGWVVALDKPDHLARAVLDALSDPERLNRMGARAYAAAASKYSRERIIAEYRALIESLWTAASPAPGTSNGR